MNTSPLLARVDIRSSFAFRFSCESCESRACDERNFFSTRFGVPLLVSELMSVLNSWVFMQITQTAVRCVNLSFVSQITNLVKIDETYES